MKEGYKRFDWIIILINQPVFHKWKHSYLFFFVRVPSLWQGLRESSSKIFLGLSWIPLNPSSQTSQPSRFSPSITTSRSWKLQLHHTHLTCWYLDAIGALHISASASNFSFHKSRIPVFHPLSLNAALRSSASVSCWKEGPHTPALSPALISNRHWRSPSHALALLCNLFIFKFRTMFGFSKIFLISTIWTWSVSKQRSCCVRQTGGRNSSSRTCVLLISLEKKMNDGLRISFQELICAPIKWHHDYVLLLSTTLVSVKGGLPHWQ